MACLPTSKGLFPKVSQTKVSGTKSRWVSAGFAWAFALSVAPAYADAPEPVPVPDATPTALEIFEPEFFSRFAPLTAHDMISQTPGFKIDESENKRGLGQGGANVLINSRRIASKSLSARDALQRISVDSVVRIEILDGASLNIPGLSGQVANVVTRGGKMTGNWNWNPQMQDGLQPRFQVGGLSVSGQQGLIDYTVSFKSSDFGRGGAGPEQVIDGDGSLIATHDEKQRMGGLKREFALELTRETLSGTIAHANLSLWKGDGGGQEVSIRDIVAGPDAYRVFADDQNELGGELSGDYEFGIGPGRLKLIGVYQNNNREPVSRTTVDYYGVQPAVGTQFGQIQDTGERILRSEYGWLDSGNNDWQVSLEGAFNFLETTTSLGFLSNGEFPDLDLSSVPTRVEEKRMEASLVHGRRLTDTMTFQGSIGAEWSELSQSGEASKVREFVRPKGFVSLSWQPDDNWDVALRLERAVGQLDFGDFVSTVDLRTESTNAGNPDLVPEQSWDLDLEGNRDLGSLGTIKLRLFARAIEDVNDRVLINGVGGPGNLDEAKLWGGEVAGTFELNDFGIPGGKLDWGVTLTDSEIEDPVTFETRRMSFQDTYRYRLQFRQDIPGSDWAWGFGGGKQQPTGNYRLSERWIRHESPFGFGGFIQNKDVLGLNMRLGVRNIFDVDEEFKKFVYEDGSRANPLDFAEIRRRNSGTQVHFRVSGNF